ncbi:PH domain-containing protein [Streptomonospora litoralis]|uniref:Bacterial membrane flanked domain protein n=1 Tax=Streptomonospora litoralis TaxID=2498135 RepID=A0A4P6Q0X2_9ACTN|nr:PH domain-containing protein [Streptomonospora litoralis]QBI54198.1 Bacterial membrane flanked domain protein [Streptomonospora litoralis]
MNPQATASGGAGWQHLNPLTAWALPLLLTVILVPSAVVAAVAAGAHGDFWPWGVLMLAGAPLLAGAAALAEYVRWRRTRYRATGERMETRSGVLVAEHRSVPRDRIRSVDVSVEIWLRPLGLCKVTVGTGQSTGSGSDELVLAYVTRTEGERLRRELLLRGSQVAAADGAPATAEAGRAHAGTAGAARELARLRPVWFGFAPVSAATPLLGAAAVGAVYNVISWFGQERANDAAAAVSERLAALPLLAVPATAAVLLTGAVAATAVQVETWWGYRLEREPDGTLRLRRGLITNTALSLEERRLRGVELREPLLLRWARGARVRAVATGLGSEAGKGGAVPRSALSPDMPRARALRLSAAVAGEAEPPVAVPLRAHPRAALRRRVTRALAAAGAVAALAAGLAAAPAALPQAQRLPWAPEQVWPAAGTAAAVAGVAAAALLLLPWAVAAYRGLGHALAPGYLVMRKGAFSRSTVALRRDGIIGWRISRSPFQRRAGLATVAATTAAGRGRYSADDVELGAGLRLADEAVADLLGQFLAAPGAQRPTGAEAADSPGTAEGGEGADRGDRKGSRGDPAVSAGGPAGG